MKKLFLHFALAASFFLGYSFKKAGVNSTYTEYHFNVDKLGYQIYSEDMKLVGRLQYVVNPSLDSLIDTDNQ